jgi:hypothetical protein
MIEARGQRKQAEQCNASEKVDPGARSVFMQKCRCTSTGVSQSGIGEARPALLETAC